ncbi:hypothetical protein LP420_38830 [Massilia sp. B-10]|nr:hypothetical protein LP420_38830 [Massilia sp. B-10]
MGAALVDWEVWRARGGQRGGRGRGPDRGGLRLAVGAGAGAVFRLASAPAGGRRCCGRRCARRPSSGSRAAMPWLPATRHSPGDRRARQRSDAARARAFRVAAPVAGQDGAHGLGSAG